MLTNTNRVHLTGDLAVTIEESKILVIQFSSFHFDHSLDLQPILFKTLEGVNKSNWRAKILKVNEISKVHYIIPYNLVPEDVPDFNMLQTMWYVYEQLRLKLLEENPTWDETKLVNNVPKGNLTE